MLDARALFVRGRFTATGQDYQVSAACGGGCGCRSASLRPGRLQIAEALHARARLRRDGHPLLHLHGLADRDELLGVIEDHRQGLVPLAVPVTAVLDSGTRCLLVTDYAQYVTCGRDVDAHFRAYSESVRNLGTPVFPRALFQAALAHASYVAPPRLIWPDSPAIESLGVPPGAR